MDSWLGFLVRSVGLDSLGMDLESCVWIPSYGLMGLKSWIWSSGLDFSLGFPGLESRVWNPGIVVLGLGSWAWVPGFGVLVSDSCVWKNEL